MNIFGITQQVLSAQAAQEQGILDVDGCAWFNEWATKQPNDQVFTYWIEGRLLTFVYGSPADFTTLAESITAYDELFADLWDRFQRYALTPSELEFYRDPKAALSVI